MYKPNKVTKKVLAEYETVGYVYRDGVVIRSTRRTVSKGIEFKKNVVDIYKCEVPIYYSNSVDATKFQGVIIFHNATILINGIKSIEIYMDNNSESLKRNNVKCDTVTLKTVNGMMIDSDLLTFQDGGRSYTLTIDNSKVVSAMSWELANVFDDAKVFVH